MVERRNDVDMSFIFLIAMGFVTWVVVTGVFQTVTVVVARRVRDKTTRR